MKIPFATIFISTAVVFLTSTISIATAIPGIASWFQENDVEPIAKHINDADKTAALDAEYERTKHWFGVPRSDASVSLCTGLDQKGQCTKFELKHKEAESNCISFTGKPINEGVEGKLYSVKFSEGALGWVCTFFDDDQCAQVDHLVAMSYPGIANIDAIKTGNWKKASGMRCRFIGATKIFRDGAVSEETPGSGPEQ